MTRDIPASVRARLLRKAKDAEEEFELYLVRYAGERFLYRVGASGLRDRLILKGAGLLALWMKDPFRATRDLDFLDTGSSDEASIRSMVTTICTVPCADDGISFDPETLDVSEIRAEQEHKGYRAVMRAFLGKARIRFQADFGVGDSVTPGPEDAEKFEAMVQLGRRNSRMKDFHDIWALSSAFPFDGPVLKRAIGACFAGRGIAWTAEVPDALGSSFYSEASLQDRWRHYVRAGAFLAEPPASFEAIGERVIRFLGPVRDSIVNGEAFDRQWGAGGPWE